MNKGKKVIEVLKYAYGYAKNKVDEMDDSIEEALKGDIMIAFIMRLVIRIVYFHVFLVIPLYAVTVWLGEKILRFCTGLWGDED